MYRSRQILLILTGVLVGAIVVQLMRSEDQVLTPVGIVVPHHDMVASARQSYFSQISKNFKPKTIVLISPDHFQTNRVPITVSTKLWKTSLGQLIPEISFVHALGIAKDAGDFESEHGITTILRDIKTNFGEATILPIMISQSATYSDVENFVNKLYALCNDCFLIASVDFSHTSQANVASLHDTLTLRELYKASSTTLYNLAEVDSPQSLAALAMWANLHASKKFDLFSHTNSGYITNTLVGEMTTHIIGGYYHGVSDKKLDNTITMMFGGDVMFAREVHEMNKNSPKETLTNSLGERFFWGVDASVVNFEGVFSLSDQYQSGWDHYPPLLRFSPSYLTALREARVNSVGLANNHIYDGGEFDYEYTKELFLQSGITSLTNASEENFVTKEVVSGDMKAVIMSIATHGEMTDISAKIKFYDNQGYRVVIFPHWGEEYSTIPSTAQQNMAHNWIEAGADLIVGSHPHVIQDTELYRGVPIIYSLGNFIFDQSELENTKVGLVLGVEMNELEQKLYLVPIDTYLAPKVINYDLSERLESWENSRVTESLGDVYYFPFHE